MTIVRRTAEGLTEPPSVGRWMGLMLGAMATPFIAGFVILSTTVALSIRGRWADVGLGTAMAWGVLLQPYLYATPALNWMAVLLLTVAQWGCCGLIISVWSRRLTVPPALVASVLTIAMLGGVAVAALILAGFRMAGDGP